MCSQQFCGRVCCPKFRRSGSVLLAFAHVRPLPSGGRWEVGALAVALRCALHVLSSQYTAARRDPGVSSIPLPASIIVALRLHAFCGGVPKLGCWFVAPTVTPLSFSYTA